MKKWMTFEETAKSINENWSARRLAREARAGRLRACQVGGRGEWITCDEWRDEWLESLATPIELRFRKRA